MDSTSLTPTGVALSRSEVSRDPRAQLAELLQPLGRLARALAQGRRGVDSDDLLQLGLEAAWRMLPAYDPNRGRLYTYVYRRARGAMLDACFPDREEPGADPIVAEETADDGPSAEESFLRFERQRVALALLSDEERELVRLCAFQGETLQGAAHKLGLDYKCAWARLRKATLRMGAA